MIFKQRNLGSRHVCPTCGSKFYDLNREDACCPKCGSTPEDENTPDPRATAMARLKSESAQRKQGDALPFGLDEEPDAKAEEADEEEEEEEEELDELKPLSNAPVVEDDED